MSEFMLLGFRYNTPYVNYFANLSYFFYILVYYISDCSKIQVKSVFIINSKNIEDYNC